MNYKDGNIEDRWNVFKQQFEIYLLASAKSEKSEPVKIAMLLNILGEKGLKIYNEMSPKPETIENLLEIYNDFFKLKTNVTYERYKFNMRKQNIHEKLEDYITELQKLAGNCKFKDLKESLIVDRIIIGINDNELKKNSLKNQI